MDHRWPISIYVRPRMHGPMLGHTLTISTYMYVRPQGAYIHLYVMSHIHLCEAMGGLYPPI